MSDTMIPFQRLVDFVTGDLSAAESADVQRQLGTMPAERATVNELRSLLAGIAGLEDAPPAAIEHVRQLMTSPVAAEPGRAFLDWLRSAERVLATLIFDSRASGALVGVRGGGSTQLAFEAGTTRVDLQITERAGDSMLSMMGQVIGDDTIEPGAIVLMRVDSDELATSTHADEQGFFEMPVEPGQYDLIVDLGREQTALVAPDLNVC